VDLPTVVLRDLLQLSSHLDLDDDSVSGPLFALVESLSAAVPSYRALHLTIVDSGRPVSLSAFVPRQDADSITTSLRIVFSALGPGFQGESHVVFYAAAPGAFVDLAADFGYALDVAVTAGGPAGFTASTAGAGQRGPDQRPGERPHGADRCPEARLVVLDADLPPPTTMSGMVGLDDLTTVNRAVGILIDQGHHPNQAHAALVSCAAAAGVDAHIYAARLLRR
jgi:hypothetical protein